MDGRTRNRLATVKTPLAAQDALGQLTGDWTTVCTMWVNVRYLSGSESIKAGADTSIAKASIRGSYRTDLTNAMRMHVGSTVFQIKAVLPDEQRKAHTDFVCEVVS